MTANGLLQLAFFTVVLLALVRPLGAYMAAVYEGRVRFLAPVERLVYAVSRVDAARDMGWREYAVAYLWLNIAGLAAVYLLLRAQDLLPLNPSGFAAVSPDLAFNTAVSFATNTNWQSYGGETTLGYLAQMAGLTVQNFVSAAAGMATLVAFIRGFTRVRAAGIGNFWSDLVRGTLYILLPLSMVGALVLVSQGVVQTMAPYRTVQLLQPVDYEQPQVDGSGQPVDDAEGRPVMEPARATEQTVPLGPAASQVIIKQLGTNGGGFFNVNSAHPLENPTPLAGFVGVVSILLIAAALCYTFGVLVRDARQGWTILAAMMAVFVPLLLGAYWAESTPNPILTGLGVDGEAGNMEGKETRFGITSSALWATATTAASNGSVNAMHDSFMPLGGLVPMWLMQLGEVIFGGVGSGLYGMLVFAIIAVFVAGLMIGRTPEYLGKKIEAFEMKMASIVILVPPLVVLFGTAVAAVTPQGIAGVLNSGAHGFSEILYAFSSAGNNNGSAFGGLTANTPFYNTALGIAMFFARYWLAIPVLAIAGSLAAKKRVEPGPGTLPTHGPLFVTLLVGTVLVVGALTFVPALALGPIVEHLTLFGGK